MAGLADFFGVGDGSGMFGGGSLYGDMLTPEQKQALAFRGLMSAAGALGQAAMPSRMPIPIGAALGQAAGAMATGQDEGAMSALRAALVGLQGQQLKSDLTIRDSLLKALGLTGGGTGGIPANVPAITPDTTQPGAGQSPADTVMPRVSASPASGGLAVGGGIPAASASNLPAWINDPETGGLRNIPGLDPTAQQTALAQFKQAIMSGGAAPDTVTKSSDKNLPLAAVSALADAGATADASANQVGGGLRYEPGGYGWRAPVPPIGNGASASAPNQPWQQSEPLQTVAGAPGYGRLTPAPAQPVSAQTPAPPVFGSLAPQPVAPSGTPATPNMMMGSINLNDPRQVIALGALGDMAKIPSLGTLLTGTPQYKAAIAAAEMGATKPIELQYAAPLAAAGAQGKLPFEGASGAIQAAKLYPVGSPERALADAFAAKTSGIEPIIGGQRPGVPIQRWNPATQNYEIIGQVPRMPEGAMTMPGPNGTVIAAPVPNAPEIATQMATANAAGPATFKPQIFHGPYGGEYLGTERQLPGMVAGAQPISPQLAPGGGGLAVGGPLAPPPAPEQPSPAAPAPTPPTGLQPGGALATPADGQRAESRAPTFPVQTPAGTKDISQLSVGDLFPGGQGIPAPPVPPPGLGYGKPNDTVLAMQKADAARVEGYGKEAAENQKVYQDLSHLRDVLGRSLNTNKLTPLWTDLTNIAHGLGADALIPKGFDPADAATFNKVATDLVFAAVKKMAGQVRVAEIEGYKQANPSLVIPRETNYSIVNDALATAKWQDARAKLSSEYLTSTGGAPLSAFEAKFNQAAPLVDVTESYKSELRKAGAVFPGDPGQPSSPPVATRVINGKTYHNFGGNDWWLQTK